MGLLDGLRRAADIFALDQRTSISAPGPSFMVDEDSIDPAVFGMASYTNPIAPAPRIDRKSAIQVPAVKRARDLICGTLGQLPIDLIGPDLRHVPSSLFDQPELGVARTVTMVKLLEDMLFEQVAWWRITKFSWTTYPEWVERLDPKRVTKNDDRKYCPQGKVDCTGKMDVDGKHEHDANLIRFDSPNDGLLLAGARAIRTCLRLNAAADRNSDGVPPMDYFTPRDEMVDPSDDEVTKTLDSWKEARQTRGTAFVPYALVYQEAGWDPDKLQMSDQQQNAVLEIARISGVDAEELGVSTTSRTYRNEFDRRKNWLDFTLGVYMTTIQDRLSMGDVTPRGYKARFKLGEFLRTDDLTRYQTYKAGIEVGAIDGTPEVRELEQKPPLQNPVPTPSPAPAPAQEVQQ